MKRGLKSEEVAYRGLQQLDTMAGSGLSNFIKPDDTYHFPSLYLVLFQGFAYILSYSILIKELVSTQA